MSSTVSVPEDRIRPLGAGEAALAALPFLLFGAASLAAHLDAFRTAPAGLTEWQALLIHPYLVFNWLALIGLFAGLLAGFPRWAFAYLAWAVYYLWWWWSGSIYGHPVNGWIAAPFLGVIALALLIRRSWQPLRGILSGLWLDWTLLSFALYVFYAAMFIIFDENHHPWLLLFIAAAALLAGLGAWGYFRIRGAVGRVLALLGGILACALLSMLSYATWDYRAYYNLPPSMDRANLAGVIFMAVLAVLMLGNGLLARWRLRRTA